MKQLAKVLDEIFLEPELKKHLIAGKMLALWPQVVGTQIAQIARAVSFRNGTLVVRVNSATWRNELMMMRESILRQLNAQSGEKKEVVDKILFR